MRKKLLLILVFMCLGLFLYKLVLQPDPVKLGIEETEIKEEQGVIRIKNLGYEQRVVQGSKFEIVSMETNDILKTITTDNDGQASSGQLAYGEKVRIQQISVDSPYQINREIMELTVSQETTEIEVSNGLMEHVQEVEVTGEGDILPTKVYLNVATLFQKPELPNGCEIVSLTALIHYYGYSVTKEQLADEYLPKEAFNRKDGKLFGPDPYLAYAGNPRNERGAFFSYADPIVIAGNEYLSEQNDTRQVRNVTGSSRQEIVNYLAEGYPVVLWTTLDLSPPKVTAGWYLTSSGEYFNAPVNLHVVVLNGYENGLVHVMNPLEGQVTYNADLFFTSYELMERRALIIQ